jgi:hypothetical protein
MVMTLLCWVFVFIKEILYLEILKERGFLSNTSGLVTSGRIGNALKECLILACHPYPFFIGIKFSFFNEAVQGQTHYNANDLMNVLNLVRLTYFLTSALLLTNWKTCSADRVW